MRDEERFYKREEDLRRMQALEKRLDELERKIHANEASIVSLTSAQKTAFDDIDEQGETLGGLTGLLHGDIGERDAGLVGQVNALETQINGISRLIHGGLLKEHNEVYDTYVGKKRSSEFTWKNWTAIAIAAITAVAALIQQWPNISAYWSKEMKAQGEVHRKVQRAKTRRRVIPVIKVVPAPEPATEP